MKRQDEKRQIVAVCCDGCKDDCLLAVHCLRGKGVCYTLDYEAKLTRLIEAAKLTVEHFSRMALYPEVNFMGDDEHEAWGALEAALKPFEEKEVKG